MTKSNTHTDPITLVYGTIPENGEEGEYTLCFIEKEHALYLKRLGEILKEAKTWGEFMSKLPPEELEYILGWMTPIPELNKPFDPCDIGPYCDGDWPEWTNQSMLRWMPKDIVSQYGGIGQTMINGEVLSISPFNQIGVVAALKKHGYTVERDDELVRRAQASHSEYHDDQDCFSDSPVWDLEEEEEE